MFLSARLDGVVLAVLAWVLTPRSDQIHTNMIPNVNRPRNICPRTCMHGRWSQEEMNEREKTEEIVPCLGATLLLTKEIAVFESVGFHPWDQDLIRGHPSRFGTFAFVHVKSDQSHG
jgi:hypothetical protein